ncbi:MAG: lipoxygenase [Elainella sp. Prado103]|jgi:arachidonate 15-lipoxygenase|nr:lipoxygenase [Elainella sp. Prado103]
MVDTSSPRQQPAPHSPLDAEAHLYTYSYTHIEPVAMSSTLPQHENFSPPWLALTAKQAINLAINTLIANRGDQGAAGVEDDVREFLRQTLRDTLQDQGPALKLKLVGALIGFLPELLRSQSNQSPAQPPKPSTRSIDGVGVPADAVQLEAGIAIAIEKLLDDLPPAVPGTGDGSGTNASGLDPSAVGVARLAPINAEIEAAKGIDLAAQQLAQGLPLVESAVETLQGMPPTHAALEVAKGIEASVRLQTGTTSATLDPAAIAPAVTAVDPTLPTVRIQSPETAAMLQNAPSAAVKSQVADGVETALQRLVQNVPANESEIEKFMSSNLVKVLGADFIKPFANRLLEGLKAQAPIGRPTSLEDYRKLFAYIELPEIANTFQTDETFAWLRVAGPNPAMIKRMTAIDPRFPVTTAQFQAVMGAEDSLQAAIQAGRVYLADYGILDGALGGSFGTNPQVQKYLYAPLALFAVPIDGGLLRPIAIQCGQDPQRYPVITPAAGDPAWLTAKTIVQIADVNFHEAVAHFARTHLLIEPFVVATHRQFPDTHPLFKLLIPHFQGTLAINDSAKGMLVAPKGGVNRLLSATIDTSRVLIVKGFLSRGFNADMLPQQLRDRGVDDPTVLPIYPYRDDALLVWAAIQDWVAAYLRLYYGSDQEVQQDEALQRWAAELVSFEGGRVPGFGNQESGKIETLDYLIDAITMLIFTASAQHAAVNFPQYDIMSFAPAMPTAGYAPAVTQGAPSPDWLDFLPPLDQAQAQLNLLYLLGSVYFTKLGYYEDNHFVDAKVSALLKKFQDRLEEINEIIDKRNQNRRKYEYLKPKNIPQSINI